ncbi:MAG: TIGR04372 family glycosyltransferase [Rhodospirillaceae bacterium]|nr:TIGR04372 family glycosyltransferase [Rhodospirillaceae bacterium]
MMEDEKRTRVDAAIEWLQAIARRGDVGGLIFEIEAKAHLDPERILREGFYLLYQIAPVPVTRAAIARFAPLIPQTEAVQNDLGFLLHGSGDPEGASAAFGLAARQLDERVARHPLASTGLRIIHPAWFLGSFGEMSARLSSLVKLRALGLMRPGHLVLPAPPEAIVNEPLLDLFAPHLTIVKGGDMLAKFQALASDLALDTNTLPLADGRFLYVQEAWRVSEKAWAEAGHGPILSMAPERLSAGRARLARIGLPADAWFVALHVRDPAFHGESEGRRRLDLAARDGDVTTYLQAVERVAARGGYVVRLGGPMAPALPSMPGLVDYAHSDVRSPEVDLVAIATARAMIATLSGPVSVASAFGTPTIHTNGLASTLHATPRDIWLPKLYRERVGGRLLSLAEMIDTPFRGEIRGSGFDDYGVDLVPNTPEDLAEATDEFLDRLEGRAPADDPAIESIFARTGNLFIAPISASFLARHRSTLLPGS